MKCFSRLMAKTKQVCASEPIWPNTTPIDKSDPYWEFNNNRNVNGIQYHKVEVSPGAWQWHVDIDAMNCLKKMEKDRSDLYFALRTRLLTNDEWNLVVRYGDRLNIAINVSYDPEEKKRELNDAYLQQFKMKMSV